jgi:hypothetical protein
MKLTRILGGLGVATAFLFSGGQVFAQAADNPLITLNELGTGTIQFPGALAHV